MTCEELIKIIKAWLEDFNNGQLTAASFVRVVESLLEVYARNK